VYSSIRRPIISVSLFCDVSRWINASIHSFIIGSKVMFSFFILYVIKKTFLHLLFGYSATQFELKRQDKYLIIWVFLFCFLLFCFETGGCYITQAGLELTILLPQPPECWD
jgi:hypothetical protein